MTKYIENVNAYMNQMKIKQTYVSLKTGIDTKKLSRILTGIQDISCTDMEKISKALGKNTEDFLSDSFSAVQKPESMPGQIAFYAGNPTKEQEAFAEKLVELVENMDVVLSAGKRFLSISE